MPRTDIYVRAIFREIQTFSVMMNINDPNKGAVRISGQFDDMSMISEGTQVSLQATTSNGHIFAFSHWEIVYGGVSLVDPNGFLTYFIMPANNVSLRAVFVPIPGSLIASIVNENRVRGMAEVFPFAGLSQGDWVTLSAHPRNGFSFSHWEVQEDWWGFSNHIGDMVTVQNPNLPHTQLRMPSVSVTIVAIFIETQYFTANVSANDPSAGWVSVSPWNILEIRSTWEQRTGMPVELSAGANPGFVFSHWEIVSGYGAFHNSSSMRTDFTMSDGDVHIRAVFMPS